MLLCVSVEGGHWEMVRMLLDAGANIDKPRPEDGSTPLFLAVAGQSMLGEPSCACGLRTVLTQIKPRTKGETPLHLAAKEGRFNMVRL